MVEITESGGGEWTVIEPARGWRSLGLRDVWQYRELLYFMVWREIKGSYRQMALGPLWIVLKPVATMVIFSLVFGKLAKLPSDGVPYPLFSYTALLPWYFFTGALNRSATSLVTNMNLIAKVYFPRLIVPLTASMTGLVDFLASFVVLLLIMVGYRWAGYAAPLTLRLLAIPGFLLLAIATALAVGLWLASFAVKFRDVAIIVTYVTQAWMYLSPVVYPLSLVPEKWQTLYRLNPMTGVIEGFRWAVLGTGRAPDGIFAVSCAVVAVLLVTGAYYFRRTERTIVDLL
ncbi:MAG: ABC transporter permease [Planctomycetota bacterium]